MWHFVHNNLKSTITMSFEFIHRPRRIREKTSLRNMTDDVFVSPRDLILPVFVTECHSDACEIESMPGIYRWPLDEILSKVMEWMAIGINAFAIFPSIDVSKKDSLGSEILNPDSLSYKVAKIIKANHLNLTLIADLALDPYTTHGHDGILGDDGNVKNDETVEILAKASLLAASSGYDVLAPSDMMDGRIGIIRKHLEKNGFCNICIMSYAAKFCSHYYGPFRDAIGAKTNDSIDKSGYQLSPRNSIEAMRELELDAQEGADILMIKPAEPYLDIINYAKRKFKLPIAAYQVSGEYSRICAADINGWLDKDECALESLTSIKRSGADMILTYFAESVCKSL